MLQYSASIFLNALFVYLVVFHMHSCCTDARGLSSIIRLVDGDASYQGRLEVRYIGEWGTVCRKGFSETAASVICRQLGYDGAYRILESVLSGPAGGVIWLEDVKCNGNEMSLFDCSYMGWGNTSCTHDDDVGIACLAKKGSIQLYADNSRIATTTRIGGVQVYYNRRWGAVHQYNEWNNRNAEVICRQLGYILTQNLPVCTVCGRIPCSEVFRYTLWNIIVNCSGSETQLTSCSVNRWETDNSCNTVYDAAGVSCAVPVQGGWSSWNISPCSQSCFGGTRTATRSCTNPSPLNGGEHCIGTAIIHESCGSIECVLPKAQVVPLYSTVTSPKNAVFHCSVTAKPQASVYWIRNGAILRNITSKYLINVSFSGNCADLSNRTCISSSTLQVLYAVGADGGEYACVGVNTAGNSSLSVQLTVNVVPVARIVPFDTNNTITSGTNVNITCTATGKPRAVINWLRSNITMRSNNSISNGGNPIIITNSTMGHCSISDPASQCVSSSTLEILNSVASDSGVYTCVATNEAGSDKMSTLLHITVSPFVTRPPENYTVWTSSIVSMHCAAAGNPRPHISWLRNEERIENVTGKILISLTEVGNCQITDSYCTISSVLQIFNTKFADGGEYICTAENAAGNDIATAQLTVNRVLYITTPPINQTVNISETVVLSCIAMGKSWPEIHWYKNGIFLSNVSATNFQYNVSSSFFGNCSAVDPCGTASVLTIINITLHGGGEYTCVATNSAGNQSRSADITINGHQKKESSSHVIAIGISTSLGGVALLVMLVLSIVFIIIIWRRRRRSYEVV